MTTQQPGFSMSQYASSKDLFAAMIARITELEAARFAYASEFAPTSDGDPDVSSIHANIRALKVQLAQRFDAADVATAAAQGFRDGMASVSPVSEPVAWQYRSVRDKGLWFDCTEERAQQRAAHPDKWDVRYLYSHPSPPEGMAGWQPIETAPMDGSYLLLWEQYSDAPFVGYWSGGSWSVSHEHVDAEGGWDGANVVDALSMPITHWMPLPPAPGPADGESNVTQ